MSRFSKFKADESATENTTEKKESKFFNSGIHVTKILSVVETGTCVKDPTWIKFEVVFEGVGGKTIKTLILVPTEHPWYEVPTTTMPFMNLLRFMEALVPFKDGKTPITAENSDQYIIKFFDDPKVLEGMKIEIKVGFTKHHPHFISQGVFELRDRYDKVILNSEGEPVRFSDQNAAGEYCKQKKLPYNSWREVIGYGLPQSGNLVGKKPKPVVAVEEDLDTPF